MKQVETKPEDRQAKEEEQAKTVEVATAGKASQVLVNKEDQYTAADFHDNDFKVLDLLNEVGSNYSFKGIMRKLNIHQQSLSRALHRLEEMGAIVKTPQGYKMGDSIGSRPANAKPKGVEYTQLLQTYIPVNVTAKDLLRQLVGKWFGNLRWLGMIDSATGYTLQWTSEDGSFQINLRLISDYVIIETNASTEKEKVQAMVGSYAIFEQISRAIQNRMAISYRVDHAGSANN